MESQKACIISSIHLVVLWKLKIFFLIVIYFACHPYEKLKYNNLKKRKPHTHPFSYLHK